MRKLFIISSLFIIENHLLSIRHCLSIDMFSNFEIKILGESVYIEVNILAYANYASNLSIALL
jgi:hypothetical protein